MDPVDLQALEVVLTEIEEPPSPPVRLIRLDGGYSWLTFRIVGANGRAVILRLAPAGGTMEPYDPAVESRAITQASGSVPTPPVLLVEQSADRLGAPFSVHGEMDGTTVRPSSQVEQRDRNRYREAFARALGRIHAVPTDRSTSITDALRAELHISYDHYVRTAQWVHPGFEIGYRWLCDRIPVSDDPAVLCHGDFRLANLLWAAPGELSAVLDWERTWQGDPMCDVAFTRLFSGWCSVSGDAIAAYQSESGLRVDEERVEYAMRFERWRSFTSSIRGMTAFSDGRNHDPRLLGIGLAGDAAAWDLVDWLEPGLPPLDEDTMAPMGVPHVPRDWLARHMPDLLDAFDHADERSRSDSLDALSTEAHAVPGLREELLGREPESAWDAAFTLLATAARTGGPELIPALKALALRSRGRPRPSANELRARPDPTPGTRDVR